VHGGRDARRGAADSAQAERADDLPQRLGQLQAGRRDEQLAARAAEPPRRRLRLQGRGDLQPRRAQVAREVVSA
jgi:hypothetical protein